MTQFVSKIRVWEKFMSRKAAQSFDTALHELYKIELKYGAGAKTAKEEDIYGLLLINTAHLYEAATMFRKANLTEFATSVENIIEWKENLLGPTEEPNARKRVRL